MFKLSSEWYSVINSFGEATEEEKQSFNIQERLNLKCIVVLPDRNINSPKKFCFIQ